MKTHYYYYYYRHKGTSFAVVVVAVAAGVVGAVISPKAHDEVLGVPLAVDSAYLTDEFLDLLVPPSP